MLFNEWKKIFHQVCGYDFKKLPKAEIKELVKTYEINSKKIEIAELIFSIHTYYVVLIKFLAAEITVTHASPFFRSFLDEILGLSSDNLKKKLQDLEEGGIFSEFGIRNFLEGDFFSWHLDLWDSNLQKIMVKITKKLLEYEPATSTLEPDNVRDLLKNLYQYLLPKKIRHDLGEFFTPDWLAEQTLDEVKYDGNFEKRFLDPSCGSGTFLVLALKRVNKFIEDNSVDRTLALEKIMNNVIGFDLNPLAVIASRTNYLMALGDLLRFRKNDINIPVYLADSIGITSQSKIDKGEIFQISTTVENFVVPASIVIEKTLAEILTLIDDCIKNNYHQKDFLDRLKFQFKELDEISLEVMGNLYDSLLSLEKKKINRIWTRLIKNAFAPIFSGKFDYVVGNPPWVNWENLPRDYRDSTKFLWEQYGLIKKSTRSGMGRVRRDITTLFVARSLSNYVKDSGKLGFVIPYNIIKTEGADGFRLFLANRSKVLQVHDVSDTKPFESATNRPGLLILQHGKTNFPVNCKIWHNEKTTGISQDYDLPKVKKITKQFNFKLAPIYRMLLETPWVTTKESYDVISKFVGQSPYKANTGVYTAFISIYWQEINQKAGLDQILAENYAGGKKQTKKTQNTLEKSIVYPLLRGRDVKKWYQKPIYYIVVPHDPKTGKVFEENVMKTKYPKTYQYFLKNKQALENRPIHKLWGKGSPFYSLYDIGDYTFSPNQVIWKDISGKISARGEFGGATVLSQITDPYLGKVKIILDDTLLLISCKNNDEAHYLAAVLNSVITRFLVVIYAVLHVRGHLLKYLNIKQYDAKDKTMQELSRLSKVAHQLAQKYYAKNDQKVVSEIDKIQTKINVNTAKLYNISSKELTEIENDLSILKEGKKITKKRKKQK